MGHKILLADDSITVQKIVKLSFSDEDVEVIAVGNGELAVQQLQEIRPDLVMADVFMPGRDGYEVCQYVKTHPELKHTPVILLVHAFEPFDPDRAISVGADRHLTKPFESLRTLVATVKELIEPAVEQAAPAPAITSTAEAAPAPIELEAYQAFFKTDTWSLEITTGEAPGSETYHIATVAEEEHFPTHLSLAQEREQVGTSAILPPFEEGLFAQPATANEETTASAAPAQMMGLDDGSDLSLGPCLEATAPGAPESEPTPLAQAATQVEADEVLELEDVLPSVGEGATEEVDLLAEAVASLLESVQAPALTVSASETAPSIDSPLESVEAPLVLETDEELPLAREVESLAPAEVIEIEAIETEVEAEAMAATPLAVEQQSSGTESRPETTSTPLVAETLQHHGFNLDYAVGQIGETASEEPGVTVADDEALTVKEQPSMTAPATGKQDLAAGVITEPLNRAPISQALIEEIVNRVVERLSEKAIQEIAWEVVPEMAEVIIRQHLAEKAPQ